MKCPLLTAGNLERFPPENEEFLDCLKEECAWWDGATEACVIFRISVSLEPLWAVLNRIENKMPHEKQFRK